LTVQASTGPSNVQSWPARFGANRRGVALGLGSASEVAPTLRDVNRLFLKVPEGWAEMTDAQKKAWAESALAELRSGPSDNPDKSRGER
jgi:hypothetical protein